MLNLDRKTSNGDDLDSSRVGLNHNQPCPGVFDPVCGTLEEQKVTFHNRCLMDKKKAVFLHKGFCSKQIDSGKAGEAQDPKKSTDSVNPPKGIGRAVRPKKFRSYPLPKKERKDVGGCTIIKPPKYH